MQDRLVKRQLGVLVTESRSPEETWHFSSKTLSSFSSNEIIIKFTMPKAKMKVHRDFKSDKWIRNMLIWTDSFLQPRAGGANHLEITDSPSPWHSSDYWGKVIFPETSTFSSQLPSSVDKLNKSLQKLPCHSSSPSLRASCRWLTVWKMLCYREVQLLHRNTAE